MRKESVPSVAYDIRQIMLPNDWKVFSIWEDNAGERHFNDVGLVGWGVCYVKRWLEDIDPKTHEHWIADERIDDTSEIHPLVLSDYGIAWPLSEPLEYLSS